jgi:hypothetical protein
MPIELDPNNPMTTEPVSVQEMRERVRQFLDGCSDAEFKDSFLHRFSKVREKMFPGREYDLKDSADGGYKLTTYHPKPKTPDAKK